LSEPVDLDDIGGVFESSIHANLATTVSKVAWLGDDKAPDATRRLGLNIVTDQWDSAGSWEISTPGLLDFARNRRTAIKLTPKVAKVLTIESASVTGTNDPSLGHVWGKLSVDDKCYDGTEACWHLGSVKASYCSNFTQGGVALSFVGVAKRVAIEVRAIAKPTLAGVGGTPPGNFAYLQYATPGATAVSENIALGDGTTTAGVWDSGWKRIEKPLPISGASANRTGVALSVGGMGGFGGTASGDCGGPAPPPWDMDLYVRRIESLP